MVIFSRKVLQLPSLEEPSIRLWRKERQMRKLVLRAIYYCGSEMVKGKGEPPSILSEICFLCSRLRTYPKKTAAQSQRKTPGNQYMDIRLRERSWAHNIFRASFFRCPPFPTRL
ncbi:hypothetical protein AVEN_235411-1 [Araneus ventricosus]|uniref:Uncharacterized protein n=1 Tax=Araneus ventricosus TaxID=182803 RepID=A0A4Y2A538_ARAVE|nr:hypothetical protein AVEN_235411-1 [Araneus ventricosus]